MKMFPIQRYASDHIGEIPWDVVAPHEEQARLNHGGQSLQRLAERGGLSSCEAVYVILDSPFPLFPNLNSRDSHETWAHAHNEILKALVKSKQ